MDTIDQATQLVEQAHNMRDKIQGKLSSLRFNFMWRNIQCMRDNSRMLIVSDCYVQEHIVLNVTGLNLHILIMAVLFIEISEHPFIFIIC